MTAVQTTSVLVGMAGAFVLAAWLRPFRHVRDERFQETWDRRLHRWLLGTAYALKPKRISDVPYLLWHSAADLARGGTRVPDPARTQARPDTFAGICRDIAPDKVLAAARLGFFPWCHFGPLKWWTRRNRMVLFLKEQHIAKRLRRDMKKSPYRVTFDEAFDDVIRACAEPRKGSYGLTWITPQIMRLYARLHAMGHAHSFEVWSRTGALSAAATAWRSGASSSPSSSSAARATPRRWALPCSTITWRSGASCSTTARTSRRPSTPWASAPFRAPSSRRCWREHAHAGGTPGPWRVEADLAQVAA